ncbi:carbamate kinase [Alkaliphilus sp. MSJ-5]|uniref:Carbamate kinase n=1 Tax=Alkaliphilus flagellatus TaxID=2841507 RepID=A0ABS6FZF3_9FIRM|nr:carbamate kinase [Alkaliphilus flagellatus]MBU5675334.1 carbamate kinase [Alkaliphilus flagellatus]
MKKEKIVIALGGNALEKEGIPATAESQLETIRETVRYVVDIIEDGYQVIVAHGNGPQVGRIVLQNEGAAHLTPSLPFDVCGAMSQGYIGYHIQQGIKNEFKRRGKDNGVISVVTQVVVDQNDPGFKNPTKPIGPFYSEEEARKLEIEKGYNVVEDAGRGYRRVVASPKPLQIVELEGIKTLIDTGLTVITVGGGGIPVIKRDDGTLEGVAAVIDKDLASEKLAKDLDADVLFILTAVEQVAINFNKPNEKWLSELTIAEAEKYITEGHFAPGSMLPKVMAAVDFVKGRPGKKAIITSLEGALRALQGETGTVIIDR